MRLWETFITLAEILLLHLWEDILTLAGTLRLQEDIVTLVVAYYNFSNYYTCGPYRLQQRMDAF